MDRASHAPRQLTGGNSSTHGGERLPAERVFWEDAQACLNRLVEHVHGAYRLLNEADWEFAARTGGVLPQPNLSWIRWTLSVRLCGIPSGPGTYASTGTRPFDQTSYVNINEFKNIGYSNANFLQLKLGG